MLVIGGGVVDRRHLFLRRVRRREIALFEGGGDGEMMLLLLMQMLLLQMLLLLYERWGVNLLSSGLLQSRVGVETDFGGVGYFRIRIVITTGIKALRTVTLNLGKDKKRRQERDKGTTGRTRGGIKGGIRGDTKHD